jgi:hypothetical protein
MKTYHNYDEDDVQSVLHDKDVNCYLGRELQMVLDALVDANFQEADEGDDDEEHERQDAAKLFLFNLATALTNGHRNKENL